MYYHSVELMHRTRQPFTLSLASMLGRPKYVWTIFMLVVATFLLYNAAVFKSIREEVGWEGYLIHKFTDAGVGHKFAEFLFSVHEAQRQDLTYCLDEESFLANSRGDDYSFMLPVIYSVFPKCKKLVAPRQVTSANYFCGEKHNSDCFYSSKRFFNDISMFRLDTEKTDDSLSVHLRFGDFQANDDLKSYETRIAHIQGLTGKQDVTFCYHSKDETETLLLALKEKFPNAAFVNSASVRETFSCLTKGRMLLTSGSSLSYLAAYLCKECVVFFSRPKELYPGASPYGDNVSVKVSVYYVDRYVALD